MTSPEERLQQAREDLARNQQVADELIARGLSEDHPLVRRRLARVKIYSKLVELWEGKA